MQYVFDLFYKLRTLLMDCVMFLSMRLYGLEYTFIQVKRRNYHSNIGNQDFKFRRG
jgi:hypothetical protein